MAENHFALVSELKWYRYPRIFRVMRGYMKLWIPVFMLLIILTLALPDAWANHGFLYGLGAILTFASGAIGSALFAGHWSDIGLNDHFIFIKFIWWTIKIPLSEIREIKIAKQRMLKRKTYYVHVQNLSAFHKFYGWLCTGSFVPVFAIHAEIEDCQEIIEKLKSA